MRRCAHTFDVKSIHMRTHLLTLATMLFFNAASSKAQEVPGEVPGDLGGRVVLMIPVNAIGATVRLPDFSAGLHVVHA